MIINQKDIRYKLFLDNKTYPFDEITPNNNHIQGELLLTHDENHGSILIRKCNDRDTLQFVHGFPKMYYYENQELTDDIAVYEKLDGSCICVYKLYDENGQVIEFVPKSRQKAILDKRFEQMYGLCDKRHINKMPEEIDCLYFELYGMLNLHGVKHLKTYIDLALIGAYDGQFLDYKELNEIAKSIQIERPKLLATIAKCDDIFKLEMHDNYYEQSQLINGVEENDFDDILAILKEYMDDVNRESTQEHSSIRYEGVVLTYGSEYIKSKPQTYFDVSGRDTLAVSKSEIRKEIHKILDEKSELLLDEYDEQAIKNEININLEEEYDKTDVYNPRVQKAVIKLLHEFIDNLPSKSLQTTINELVELNPGLSVGEYMKLFAIQNPSLKHKSRLAYNMIIKKIN